ncbi:helix-turn-helix domain-containing protein [Streptomyces beijiangensis]|uniref:XRE family transcriptional regulator n=1 Tax=Streptomyces beijiangensis TaxID=163361 RepID=A0A939FA78_9ACTN|nr:XRE family transcriptional regulator [Streptomyces beijiangensis]MBO0514571.1 XRE family transcriptional regulator [Streptomyces beijiangensis]
MNADRELPAGAVTWDELKGELFDDEDREVMARLTEVMLAQVRAYRLAEIRKRQHTTQVELAQRMGISQARVSDIERGKINRSEVDTLAAYVAALGGQLQLVANFGDESVVLA